MRPPAELARACASRSGMRKKVDVSELHDLITREFAKTVGDSCLRCRIPKPVFRHSATGPNWRLGAVEECDSLCHSLIADIAAKLGENYQLESP